MESVNAMNGIMTWGIALCGGIICLFLIVSIVKDGMEFARGGASMTSVVGKVFFLIVIVGIVFAAQNLPTMLGNGEPVNDNVAYNDLEPDTEYVVSSEVVTETPTEQATEAQVVTEEPATEAPAAVMSDKEFNDKWSYAVKHEYDFYYMSSNGNSVKRNPAYIDSSLYRVEFDDTNHIVRLYDK